MKKTNMVGFGSILSGTLLWGYVALTNMMGKSQHVSGYGKFKGMLHHKSLFEILPEGNFDWINSIPWPKVQGWCDYVVKMPLWLLLIIIGAVLLIIGGLFIKK